MKKYSAAVSHHASEVEALRADREQAIGYLKVAMAALDDPEDRATGLLALRAITKASHSRVEAIDGKENFNYSASKQPGSITMAALTVTAKGQVTFKRDLLQHLGIEPGGRIDIEKLPNGELRLRASRPAGTVDGFIGLLAGKTSKVVTIEEMNKASAAGWAGDK